MNRYKNSPRQTNLERGGAVAHVNEWRHLCKKYGCCLCCKKKLEIERLTRDHIIPVCSPFSRNGIHNLQPLCEKCNGAKGNLTIDFRPDHSSVLIYLLPVSFQGLYKMNIKSSPHTPIQSAKEKANEISRQNHKNQLQDVLTERNEKIKALNVELSETRIKKARLEKELARIRNQALALPLWVQWLLQKCGWKLEALPSEGEL